MDENPYKSPSARGSPVRAGWQSLPLWAIIIAGVLVVSTAFALIDYLIVQRIQARNAASAPP